MKFYDRKIEIEKLREIERISHNEAQFTVVSGRRRIGKTVLVKKAYEDIPMLYFFVARKAESELCSIFMEEIKQKLDIPIVEANIKSFSSVFKYVMELSKERHITLLIDEFQDFYRVNPSVFSDMQNIWDSYKNESHINLIVCGSVNSLLNRIFKDKKEPLFGRQTESMKVNPFPPSVLKEIMADNAPNHTNEDLLALYTLTGGVAKYVELFVDRNCLTQTKMLDAFFMADSYFLSEGKNMLIDEFGRDYGVYFSILTLISQGNNTHAEIEDMLGGIELAGYLKKLADDYSLISKRQPLYERSVNKNVHYALEDHFLRFWFRFVYKYLHVIEAGGHKKLRQIVDRDYKMFSGYALEAYFRDSMKESGEYTRIGYWHDRKGENEIDIIAEDEVERRVEIYEVKRQEKHIDFNLVKHKVDVYMDSVKRYENYTVEIKGLSIEDL